MRPINLKVKGLNSFIEEQTVDFEVLTDRGLFGIFGPTGSGKSTILDGITLALYGEVARKSENFINTNCKTASVSFEFQISGKIAKRYLVSRDFKVHESGKPRSQGAKLLEITGGEPIVLADKKTQVDNKIKEIIGLDSVDFTRTVVLPQGKFSEFLSLEGKPRREMLERLFNLQEYGDVLSIKLSKKMAIEKESLSILHGKLSGYEDISEEKLKEEKDKKSALVEELETLKKDKKKVDKDYEEGEKLYNLLKEQEEYKKEEELLEGRKEEIEELTNRVKKGESALKVNPYLKAYLGTKEEIKNIEDEREKNKLSLQNIKKEKEEVDKELLGVKSERDKKIPELRVKEQSIKEGMAQNQEIKKIEDEVNLAKTELDYLRNIYQEKKAERENLAGSIKLLKDEVTKMEEKVETLKIDEVLKSLVQKGLLQEEKYISTRRHYTQIYKKLEDNKVTLEKDLKELKSLEEDYNKVNEELKLCTEKLKFEEENTPGTDTDLINLNQAINEGERKWDAFNKLSSEKERVEGSLKEDEERLTVLAKSVEELNVEVASLKEKIKSEREKNLANSLREGLREGESCPVCGSKEHFIEGVHLSTSEEIKALDEKLEEREETLKKEVNELSKLEERVNIGRERREKILEEVTLLGEDFKGIDISVLKENFLSLKEKININTKRKKELTEEKEVLGKKQLDLSSKLKAKEGKAEEGEKNLNTLKSEEEEVKTTLKEEEEKLNLIKETSKVEDFNLKSKEIQEKERLKENLQREIKSKRVEIDKEEIIEKKKAEELTALGEDGKAKKGSLEEKTKNLDEKRGALKLKFGDVDLGSLLIATQEEIEKLEKRYTTLEERKIKVDEEHGRISDYFISLVTKLEELSKRVIKEEESLANSLKEENFASLEEAVESLISKEAIERLKISIAEYKEKLDKVKGAIESLLKKIDGKTIGEEEFNLLKEEKLKKEEEIGEKEKEKVRVEEGINLIKKKLEEFKDLIKEKDELDKRLSLLKELEGLLKGKKLVEYMATSQLKYISLEASKKLKDITGGIYGLEVDQDGRFLIRDYKNGGVARDASTLSGGETFLASLCLALALSSQIQLKGTAPLELFFLDEGFGTLDENLLEVVMGSLEKIHNEKLKVGIISHVESIKNRIPVKLIVSPAESGKGGSKVKVERS